MQFPLVLQLDIVSVYQRIKTAKNTKCDKATTQIKLQQKKIKKQANNRVCLQRFGDYILIFVPLSFKVLNKTLNADLLLYWTHFTELY